MLNTDSGKSKKVFSLKPESVFNLNQNRCSDWAGMGVQLEPEYATLRFDLQTIMPRFLIATANTPPMPGRLLKLAEAYG